MDHTSTEAQVVLAERPRQRVRKLKLVAKDVGGSRLSDGEGHTPAACVRSRENLRFPQRDGIAMQVGKTRFVEEMRVEDRGVIQLNRPRPARVTARDAWCTRAADCVLWVVVVKSIDVRSEHQCLTRCELVVQPCVDERLSVVTRVVEATVSRQHEGSQ